MIYHSIVSIRFNDPALSELCADLVASEQFVDLAPVPALPLRDSIALHKVSFAYPNADKPALRDVSLVIPAHSAVGLVGTTGAGKSTAVDLLLGLLEPQEGQLLVDGEPITPANARSWQRSIGYVPQQIFLADESIAANIAFGLPPENIDMAAVERAARMANLHDFIMEDLPNGYMSEVGDRGVRLSGGQRQRLAIARALYHDPQVVVFDEATSALDTVTERAVMEAVQSLSGRKTLIMVAHRLSTVQACDTVFFFKKGQLVASGSFDGLTRTNEDFAALAGTA